MCSWPQARTQRLGLLPSESSSPSVCLLVTAVTSAVPLLGTDIRLPATQNLHTLPIAWEKKEQQQQKKKPVTEVLHSKHPFCFINRALLAATKIEAS